MPSGQVPVRRAGRGPEPERAVDVHPRVVPPGDRDRGGEVVEGAGVHLARLQADDRRAVAGGERRLEGGDGDPALVVGVDLDHRRPGRGRGSARRGRSVSCRWRPTTTRTRGASNSPRAATSQPCAGQHRVPGRREAGVVGHHPAGDEADRRRRRAAPARRRSSAGDDLDGGGGGGQRVDARRSGPRRWSARRRRGRRAGARRSRTRRTAARPSPASPGSAVAASSLDHGDGVGPRLGQGTVERGQHLLERRPRPHRPLAEPGQELRGQLVRPVTTPVPCRPWRDE